MPGKGLKTNCPESHAKSGQSRMQPNGRYYFFSEISMVARVFSQSKYIWQPVPISWNDIVKFSTGPEVFEGVSSAGLDQGRLEPWDCNGTRIASGQSE